MVTTTIDVQPDELAAALRKAGLSEIETGTRRRAEYTSDASNYRVAPLVVAFPRTTDDLIAALGVCGELGVPLVGRGAGTSIAGNALSAGLVLDTSRHLNRVLSVDPERRTAVVEPGAVLDSVTSAAAPFGLRFGPDPSTHSRATIGGAIGNNACGSRALRYGRSADNVVALDVLAGTGVRFTAARYGKDGQAPSAASEAGLLADLRALAGGNLATIRTEFGRFTRQVSGYSMEHLLPENDFDVAKFLSGTEGSLALTLGATVRLVDAPRATALAVLGYPDMPAAAEAVPGLLPHLPVALEGLDSRLVDVVRVRRRPAAVPDLPRGGGWLFAETSGDTVEEAVDAARKLAASLTSTKESRARTATAVSTMPISDIEAPTTRLSPARSAMIFAVRMTMSAAVPLRNFSAMAPTAPNSPAISRPVSALKSGARLATRPWAAPPLKMFKVVMRSIPSP